MRHISLVASLTMMGCVTEGSPDGFPDTAPPLQEPTEPEPAAAICSVVPDGGPAICPTDTSTIPFQMIGPNVQLVVDRSASMRGDKWDELGALTPYLPLVGARANLGLTFFPSPKEDGCGTAGGTVLPMTEGMSAAQDVEGWLLQTEPQGKTPIADTLSRLVGRPGLQCPNRDNIVVLLSDGAESCLGDPASVARELTTQPVPVELYVIGFATTGQANATLQDIAAAGQETSGPDNFYTASTADELVARLAAVTATCTAQINEPFDPDAIEVHLDRRRLSECTEAHCGAGYSVDREWGNIRIEGADCLALLDGECHDLQFAHAQ